MTTKDTWNKNAYKVSRDKCPSKKPETKSLTLTQWFWILKIWNPFLFCVVYWRAPCLSQLGLLFSFCELRHNIWKTIMSPPHIKIPCDQNRMKTYISVLQLVWRTVAKEKQGSQYVASCRAVPFFCWEMNKKIFICDINILFINWSTCFLYNDGGNSR